MDTESPAEQWWRQRRQEKLDAISAIGQEIEANDELERMWMLPSAPTSPPMGK